jgi:hypothetical protein
VVLEDKANTWGDDKTVGGAIPGSAAVMVWLQWQGGWCGGRARWSALVLAVWLVGLGLDPHARRTVAVGQAW